MFMLEEVQKGAALLDEKKPGWKQAINLSTLNLNRPERCVLGQVYGHYYNGREELGLDIFGAESYGFDIPIKDIVPGIYDSLTETWKSVITA